jgi:hypothetical protein
MTYTSEEARNEKAIAIVKNNCPNGSEFTVKNVYENVMDGILVTIQFVDAASSLGTKKMLMFILAKKKPLIIGGTPPYWLSLKAIRSASFSSVYLSLLELAE